MNIIKINRKFFQGLLVISAEISPNIHPGRISTEIRPTCSYSYRTFHFSATKTVKFKKLPGICNATPIKKEI